MSSRPAAFFTSVTLLACAAAATFAQSSPRSPGLVATNANADEVRAIVAEMLADAETRSSLVQGAAAAGHDGRFYLASADGNFRLNIGGQAQFRYIANFRDDEGGDADDFEPGFMTSRTALRFDGHIFEPSLFYAVQGMFESQGGSFVLEDAYVGKQFSNGIILIWGQLRMPVLWEDVIQEKFSLAVDQSVVNAVFNQGRSQGVWVHYSADDWRFWAGFSDGIRSANTSLGADPADWAVTTRWELKFNGDWSQFDSFSSPRGSALAVKLGGGAHFEQSPDMPGVPVNDLFAATADLMTQGDGWNVFLAGVLLYTDLGGGGGSFTDYGVVLQGGLYVTDNVEPFLRYDVVIPDGDRVGDDAFNTLTFGANYYLHGHAARLTVDGQWYLDATTDNDLVSGVAGSDLGRRIGLLPSADSGQFALRIQFQLLF